MDNIRSKIILSDKCSLVNYIFIIEDIKKFEKKERANG